jgi:plasmid replication initiation protein
MEKQAVKLIATGRSAASGQDHPTLHVVQKALEAIQINVVVGELSLLQRKILNILLENAKSRLSEIEVHEIPFRDIVRRLEYNSNDYKPIRAALDELPARRIKWNYLDPGTEKDYGVSAYISEVKYVGDKVRYAYPPTVREMLHSPRRFAVLNLAVQNAFSRQCSLPLYEIVKQSLQVGETPTYSIVQWRDLLGLPKGKSYDEFKHFRAKVLNPAIEEVNSNTDVTTEPVFHRQGRNIVSMSFTVASNPQLPLQLECHSARAEEIVARMVALGFKESQARQYLTLYPESYLLENLDVVENRHQKGQLKTNPAGYLAKAFKLDYRPVETAQNKAAREAEARAQVARAKVEARNDVYDKLWAEFSLARDEAVKGAVDLLSAGNKTTLEEDFLQEMLIGNPLVASQYRRSGLKSMIVRSTFQEFAARKLGFGDRRALFTQFVTDKGLDPKDFAERLPVADDNSSAVAAAA